MQIIKRIPTANHRGMTMSRITSVALREMQMGFRNPWAYSFMVLFALLLLALLLINAQGYVQGYSSVTGTMLNLVLYLLPLMTLMLGSFSLAGEKEDGSWELLSAYPLSTISWIWGKYAGLGVVHLTIIMFGFGIAGVAGAISGNGFSLETYVQLFTFSVSLALMFLAISMLVGTLARNRWQALTVSVAIWFFLVMAWAPLLIAVLGFLPYMWIKPAVSVLTLFNPAELSRLFAIVWLGGGAVLGPEYYEWVKWIRTPYGIWGYCAFLTLWIVCWNGLAALVWERGRTRV